MSDLDQKNSKKQGDVGLGIAIGWFASKGYTVCIPLTDSQPYDLLVDLSDNIQRVQVKTTKAKSSYGIYIATLITKGGNRSGKGKDKLFDSTKVDILFVYIASSEIYVIPSISVKGKRNIYLGKVYKSFKM